MKVETEEDRDESNNEGEYALRALIVLGDRPCAVHSIAEVAEKTLVPIHYLEQILLQLKNLGYVKSKRGVQGGYSLRRPAADIVVGDVVRQLEGPLAPMGCVSLTAYDPCPLEAGCLLKPLWALVRDTVAQVLDNTTLEDLLNENIREPS
ncbi:RrF2 family transcriptional regulator [Novibacillus thermophilus]|uniref:RrF2 family transcriptional regulator n=1 Tax=Novibacillus thermophilus TaxID=1471761 RepID=UPI001E5AD450|nr:Rrf2 family transcriptional regulator [Novibacillus thermophilus]